MGEVAVEEPVARGAAARGASGLEAVCGEADKISEFLLLPTSYLLLPTSATARPNSPAAQTKSSVGKRATADSNVCHAASQADAAFSLPTSSRSTSYSPTSFHRSPTSSSPSIPNNAGSICQSSSRGRLTATTPSAENIIRQAPPNDTDERLRQTSSAGTPASTARSASKLSLGANSLLLPALLALPTARSVSKLLPSPLLACPPSRPTRLLKAFSVLSSSAHISPSRQSRSSLSCQRLQENPAAAPLLSAVAPPLSAVAPAPSSIAPAPSEIVLCLLASSIAFSFIVATLILRVVIPVLPHLIVLTAN